MDTANEADRLPLMHPVSATVPDPDSPTGQREVTIAASPELVAAKEYGALMDALSQKAGVRVDSFEIGSARPWLPE